PPPHHPPPLGPPCHSGSPHLGPPHPGPKCQPPHLGPLCHVGTTCLFPCLLPGVANVCIGNKNNEARGVKRTRRGLVSESANDPFRRLLLFARFGAPDFGQV